MSATLEAISPSFQERMSALACTKQAHTEAKVARKGYFDTDDHGYIPWDEPIPFEPVVTDPSGLCCGPRDIGDSFRRWLQVHPVYIHPMSALAGAWISAPPGVGAWRPEDRAVHLDPIHEKYNIRHTGVYGMNHIGPDMAIGLDLGWGGLLNKIRHFRDLNRPEDSSFYDGEEALVLGVQEWIGRHVVESRRLAEMPENAPMRESLLQIAEMNTWLVDNPPRTLREACQFLAWFQSVDRMWALGGALGQIDELLRPYYEADLAAGLIDDDEGVWYIASLFFNDTHYSQIGGPAPADGRDQTSRMSFLVLEAMHRLRIPTNIALRVHDGLNPELMKRALEYQFEDGTGVSFACSKGLDEGYARNGVPIQMARMRAKVGCNWTALPGIEYCLQDVTRMCMVSPFLHAFRDTMDGDGDTTMEALWTNYEHHLAICVDTIKQGFDWHLSHKGRNKPEIVLNLFMHGPIERGLDASAGGVDIYRMTCDGVGLATVADSLAAIEQRVVREGRLTWEELDRHLATDFEGTEDVRLMLSKSDRFGAGNSLGDTWAKRVSDLYTNLMRGTPTADGYTVIPGLFSHGGVARLGEKLGATPNGRRAGGPISHSADPDPGFAPGGGGTPTAKANAVAAVQPGWGNTTPLQLDIDAQLARQVGGIEAVESLIGVHNEMGGTLINLNIVSKAQILEAHADPEKYPDLVVRVTGYSAFFKTLSPEYRQQVVDRILAE